jgi:hypothetical protein
MNVCSRREVYFVIDNISKNRSIEVLPSGIMYSEDYTVRKRTIITGKHMMWVLIRLRNVTVVG